MCHRIQHSLLLDGSVAIKAWYYRLGVGWTPVIPFGWSRFSSLPKKRQVNEYVDVTTGSYCKLVTSLPMQFSQCASLESLWSHSETGLTALMLNFSIWFWLFDVCLQFELIFPNQSTSKWPQMPKSYSVLESITQDCTVVVCLLRVKTRAHMTVWTPFPPLHV